LSSSPSSAKKKKRISKQRKAQDQTDSLVNSTRPLKNTNAPELFHKIQRGGILPKTFYEASFTLIPKPSKERSKETYKPTFLMK
jgi:hypothetical protein